MKNRATEMRKLPRAKLLFIMAVLLGISWQAAKAREVSELTLKSIVPGAPYRWMTGAKSGEGRWVVKDGVFGTHGAGYIEATSKPAMVMGNPPGNPEETMQWSRGTTHVLIGKNQLKGVTFQSDPDYPLTFKLVEGEGYVYLCGKGVVTDTDGNVYELGHNHSVEMWLQKLKGSDDNVAEGAAQALGYYGGHKVICIRSWNCV